MQLYDVYIYDTATHTPVQRIADVSSWFVKRVWYTLAKHEIAFVYVKAEE